MPILSNLIVRIGASTDDFDKQVDRSLNKVKRFASDVTAAGTALSIGFSAPLIAAGAAAIKAGSDMESLTMGLKAVMKTSEATAAEMAKLREVAKLPGLGLEEAVKGTIRLQILGHSANESRRIMAELGNALAVVGGGREDFNEVIRQLSQLGAVGKVTKENLDPIIERIPQLAAIIKEKFGAEALGDPAKTFERMGISSQKFIQIITDELAKGERAGNTFKNSWENIQTAAKDAAAEFGKTLLPIAQRVLDDFLTPGIEKAKALATAFRDLPQPTQDWALGLTAVATAAPLVVAVLGTLAEKAALLAGVLNKAGITGATFGAALGTLALGLKSVDEALLIYEKLKETGYQFERLTGACSDAKKNVEFFRAVIVDLSGKFPDLSGNIKRAYDAIRVLSDAAMLPGFGLFKAALEAINTATAAATGRSKEMDSAIANLNQRTIEQGAQNIKLAADMKNFNGAAGDLIPKLAGVADAHKKTAEAASNLIKVNTVMLDQNGQLSKNSLVYVESLERVKAAVSKAKDVMYEYSIAGTLIGKTLETHKDPMEQMALATMLYRQELDKLANSTAAVQAIGRPVGFPGLPTDPGNVGRSSDFPGMGKAFPNIGPTGMMTREQLEAQKQKMKELGKVGKAAYQQISTVATDLSRGITDIIFKGGKLGDMLTNVAKQAAQSITRLLIEGALKKLTDKLFDVGGLMGKVFGGAGGPAAGSAGGSVASAAGSAAGGIGGAAGGIGGAASAASGSLTAVVGAVGSVVSAISGVIGNFQMMAMNKALDIIAKHTLQIANDLANLRADEWMREGHLMAKLDDMWKTNLGIYDLLGRGAVAGGGASVVINLNGGDPKAALEEITRTLKQYGVIPRG
jgi:tape measure domain-containing protein